MQWNYGTYLTLTALRRKANATCVARGHNMMWTAPWHGEHQSVQQAECRMCTRLVQVTTKPEANGINIGGDALAIDCR